MPSDTPGSRQVQVFGLQEISVKQGNPGVCHLTYSHDIEREALVNNSTRWRKCEDPRRTNHGQCGHSKKKP